MPDLKAHVAVLVVGGGPTGLTTANLLGALGIETLLIERNTTTSAAAKAISIDDESLRSLAEYEREVTGHVVAAGGQFLVRGADYVPIEGDWHPKRLIIVKFPDVEAIERYYNSEPNQRLKRKRLAGTAGKPAKAIAIRGLDTADDNPAGGSVAVPEAAGVDGSGAPIWR